jgi:CTP:molybdopterin cytidylyltransferase MocA
MVHGIVLAAGEGRRMGGVKALLDADGTTLVERHVTRLVEIGCTSVVIVVRPTAAASVRVLLLEQARARVEAVETCSQAESLAAGLRVLDASRHDVIVVTPVDMLPAETRTHRALFACLEGPTLAVTPSFRGHGGHPVVARREVFAKYDVSLPPLRELLASLGTARQRIEVDDPLVLGDLDTPSDLHALQTIALTR